jgi:hypothetical protein
MSTVTPNQIAKVIIIIAQSGIERNALQKLLESGRFSELLQEFSELLQDQAVPTVTTYKVTVDYSMSLADMIAAGKYDMVTKEMMTQARFPFEARDAEEVELHLVHFDRETTTREVLAELVERGLRPATLPELCALGAFLPQLQRQFHIVALGSRWQNSHGYLYYPLLQELSGVDKLGGARKLTATGWDDEPGDWWFGNERFLAVSK